MVCLCLAFRPLRPFSSPRFWSGADSFRRCRGRRRRRIRRRHRAIFHFEMLTPPPLFSPLSSLLLASFAFFFFFLPLFKDAKTELSLGSATLVPRRRQWSVCANRITVALSLRKSQEEAPSPDRPPGPRHQFIPARAGN